MKCKVQAAGVSFAPIVDHPIAFGDPHHRDPAIVAARKVLFSDFADQFAAAAVLPPRAMDQAGPDFFEQGKAARFLICVFE